MADAHSRPGVKIGSHWVRPRAKVYDYNYKLGAHYYQPITHYLDSKGSRKEMATPGHMTFAERLHHYPLYGETRPYHREGEYPTKKFGLPEDDTYPRRRRSIPDVDDFLKDAGVPRRPKLDIANLPDEDLDALLKSPKAFEEGDEAPKRRRPLRLRAQDMMDMMGDPFGKEGPIDDKLREKLKLMHDDPYYDSLRPRFGRKDDELLALRRKGAEGGSLSSALLDSEYHGSMKMQARSLKMKSEMEKETVTKSGY